MPQGAILPEGSLIGTPEMRDYTDSARGMERAFREGAVLEGIAECCDASHDLLLRLPGGRVRIPRAEAAEGIGTGAVRDIAVISRVGKPVAFRLSDVSELRNGGEAIASRREVQEEARAILLAKLLPGEILRARVTHTEPFGCFADVGRGVVSMIGADRISVSRIRHASDRFRPGQDIFAVVLGTERETGRILLSHRELLGTWAENAARISVGETVRGIVRGVESYGVFVELFPNLSGLAENCPGLREGDEVSVFIKSIYPERMKIKLVIIDRLPGEGRGTPLTYFRTSGRMSAFRYAPEGCLREGFETTF